MPDTPQTVDAALRELQTQLDDLQARVEQHGIWLSEIHEHTVGAGLWPRIKRIARTVWRVRKQVRRLDKLKATAKKVSAKLGLWGKVAVASVAVAGASVTVYTIASSDDSGKPGQESPAGGEPAAGSSAPVPDPPEQSQPPELPQPLELPQPPELQLDAGSVDAAAPDLPDDAQRGALTPPSATGRAVLRRERPTREQRQRELNRIMSAMARPSGADNARLRAGPRPRASSARPLAPARSPHRPTIAGATPMRRSRAPAPGDRPALLQQKRVEQRVRYDYWRDEPRREIRRNRIKPDRRAGRDAAHE